MSALQNILARFPVGIIGRSAAQRWSVVVLLMLAVGLLSCETTESVGEELLVAESLLQAGEVVGTIYFKAESSAVSEQSLRAIEEIARMVMAATAEGIGVVLAVHGHTALAGTTEGRARLSRKRAEMVAAQLQALGIESSMLMLDSFGAARLATDDNSEAGKELNRRAVISVLSISNDTSVSSDTPATP